MDKTRRTLCVLRVFCYRPIQNIRTLLIQSGAPGLPNGLENGFPCVRQPHRHRRTGILSYGQKVRCSRTAYRHIPAIAAPPAAYIPTELPPMAR